MKRTTPEKIERIESLIYELEQQILHNAENKQTCKSQTSRKLLDIDTMFCKEHIDRLKRLLGKY
jgi:uncharacterized membrane protein